MKIYFYFGGLHIDTAFHVSNNIMAGPTILFEHIVLLKVLITTLFQLRTRSIIFL